MFYKFAKNHLNNCFCKIKLDTDSDMMHFASVALNEANRISTQKIICFQDWVKNVTFKKDYDFSFPWYSCSK